MLKLKQDAVVHNNFNLKNVEVDVLPSATSVQAAFVSVEALEAGRAGAKKVPASKHGLETICGASCETGAQ